MPRVEVTVHATVGSQIGRYRLRDLAAPSNERHGWPVGLGRIVRTRGADGEELEALVLMTEPALAGVEIHAWPIGLLRIGAAAARPLLLCVAEDDPFMDLVDLAADGNAWHADPQQWCDALALLDPMRPPPSPARCLGHDAAAQFLSNAQHRFTQARQHAAAAGS